MKKLLLLIALFLPLVSMANPVMIRGLYYNLNGSTAEVTSNPNGYNGDINIPSIVDYEGKTYNVVGIGECAFYPKSNIKSVSIPNSILYIGDAAFFNSGLTSIKIPGNVKSVGSSAFAFCANLESAILEDGIDSLGNGAFSNCEKLVNVSIPSTVTYTEGVPFVGTPWYDNLPDGLIYIGKVVCGVKGTLPENSNIEIKEGTVRIGRGAFYGQTGLTSFTLPSSIIYIDYDAFEGTTWLNNQEDGIVYIGNVLYKYKGEMPYDTEISIREGITIILENTFRECRGLKKITLPSTLLSIGPYAFERCIYLKSLKVPENVTDIGNSAFSWCADMEDLEIGRSVNNIGENAFYRCYNLKNVKVDEECKNYDSRSGCNAIIETSTNTLIVGSNSCTSIPEGVVAIGDGAFWGAGLETVNIPSSVKTIGWDSFRELGDIKTLVIPEGVVEIKGGAFSGCLNLESIELPTSLDILGYSVFENTKWLNSQPDGMVYLGGFAYIYKGNMPANTNIRLKDGTLSVAGRAFVNCENLASIEFPEGLKTIGPGSFQNCKGLTNVTLPNSLKYVDDMAFAWAGLNTLVLGEDISSIGGLAFFESPLSDVYCYAKDVPKFPSLFGFSAEPSATLHVPSGLLNNYKSDEYWKSFRFITTISENDPKPTEVKPVFVGDSDNSVWYDINGKKLKSKPTTKGVFINNGKKVITK